jgi:hypothetical protein
VLKWIAGLAGVAASAAVAAAPNSATSAPVASPPVITRSIPSAPTAAATRVLPAPDAERMRLATQAAALAIPEQVMVDAVLAGWDRGQERAKPEMEALDAVSPGLSDKIIAIGKTELLKLLHERLPTLRTKMTDVSAANLTADELRSTLAFYGSPTGKEFIRKMLLADTGDDMGSDMAVSSTEIAAANRKAARESVGSLETSQKADLIRFGFSPAGRAMRAVGEKLQPAAAEWMTSLMQDYEVRINPMIEKMVGDAIAHR